MVTHGFSDLTCPYFNTKMLLSQMAPLEHPERLRLKVYPGGHMFYSRPESLTTFCEDARPT